MVLHKMKRSFLRRFCILLSVILIVTTVSQQLYGYGTSQMSIEGNDDLMNPTDKLEYRDALSKSPFRLLYHKIDGLLRKTELDSDIDISQNERALLSSWDQGNKLNQCKLLFSSVYESESLNWSNQQLFEESENYEGYDVSPSLISERMRIYNYCILQSMLNVKDLFDFDFFKQKNIDAWDYQVRMFPFLRQDFDKENQYLYPEIFDISNNEMVSKPKLKLTPLEFNRDFWRQYKTLAKGKGIVTTLHSKELDFFYRQLKVLQKLDNKLPIYIVSSDGDITDNHKNELFTQVKETTQQVYVVGCSQILNPSFSQKHLKSFLNKWVAILFNPLEEVIFMDADAVPLISVEDYFKYEDYKESGLYVFKDRVMPHKLATERCIAMLHFVEPSAEENSLLGENSMVSTCKSVKTIKKTLMAKGVYDNFFEKAHLHQVDSGLVILNRKKKLNAMLMSFLLHLLPETQVCFHGDKELFWIGPLFMDEPFSVHPTDPGLAGQIFVRNNENEVQNQICSSQIVHSDLNHNILWVNGGLKVCKVRDSEVNDFSSFPDYFRQRYKDENNLKSLYNAPLYFEGLIIPNPSSSPWFQTRECSMFAYCSTVSIGNEGNKDTFIRFNHDQSERYNSIAALWSS
ncbi:hypothetical protein KAFR_0K01260 [Kazachstania africana CBS 2517]|uniref:Alpha-1,3-mannosyltransferase n=1 Tax=Kazachstania africana (strain ATCC 22294 / BCRC 22015 / CBS 2517 / CECT 1963 / NBRC 1671 / NRRL Y-8276) TaxID=1071382 RepID=H2B1I0_KAZAF|nr:hypothetical protein KAFR_0K01260 [Kazachstania africana CBS 2517]CCF60480.1 hypothetical protein KAFR_0K01260 [Kazachstania africana CBS 2517]